LKSAHHSRYGFPHHAIVAKSIAPASSLYNNDISAAQITSAFTLLYHFQLEGDSEDGKHVQFGEDPNTKLKLKIDDMRLVVM